MFKLLMSYREARNFTGIPLLKARRETLCEQFFKKNENNDKLSELLHHKTTADYTICVQDASITIIYVELNVLGNRFFLKLFPKKTVNN